MTPPNSTPKQTNIAKPNVAKPNTGQPLTSVEPLEYDYDFDESVGYWLTLTSQMYQRVFNEDLAPKGITFRQAQVLSYLGIDGPSTQAQLAERIGIEPPTLVGILDRMERDGLINRTSCTVDRRKKWIVPTAAAKPVWNKIAESGHAIRRRATQGLSAGDLVMLRRLLTQIQANLSDGSKTSKTPNSQSNQRSNQRS